MNSRKASLMFAVAALAAVPSSTAVAQQPPAPIAHRANPAPGCTATPEQLAENKKVASEFFRVTGDARVALADPSYKQHNPAFKKRAADRKISDYEEFVNSFSSAALAARPPAPASTGPQPPPGNPYEVVTAECDIVTFVRKAYLQDPTAPPGTFYEAFTFDSFRVRNGKLVEHWDSAVIPPPAPSSR